LTFPEVLMQMIWQERQNLRAGELDNYDNLSAAVYALRTMTGLTVEQLAARLSLNTYKLNLIEKRGGPVDMADIHRMVVVARDFSLNKLVVYFERMELLQRGKMRKKRPVHATL
jgi:transcriptional regulator with XRE-family HTH domain